MKTDFLRGKLKFIGVEVLNSIDGFLFETAIDINIGIREYSIFNLTQQKGVQFANPVFS